MPTATPAAQATPSPSSVSASQRPSPTWSGGVEAYWYSLGAESFLMPIASADRAALHLEGRYQYEALSTASTWVGWSVRREVGARALFTIVPMAGVLFGRSYGAAAGLEMTLSLTHFELYDESEVVLIGGGGNENFLYSWFTGAWHATTWLDLGLTVQRTRTHAS